MQGRSILSTAVLLGHAMCFVAVNMMEKPKGFPQMNQTRFSLQENKLQGRKPHLESKQFGAMPKGVRVPTSPAAN